MLFDKRFYCRGTGEEDGIGTFHAEAFDRRFLAEVGFTGSVEGQGIDNGTAFV